MTADLPATHPGPGETPHDFGRRLAAAQPLTDAERDRFRALIRTRPADQPAARTA